MSEAKRQQFSLLEDLQALDEALYQPWLQRAMQGRSLSQERKAMAREVFGRPVFYQSSENK